MKLCVLASGSAGNSIYIESSKTRVLVDGGLSAKGLTARLNRIGVRPDRLDAIVISHEHIDHIRGAGAMARAYGLDIYINPLTRAKAEAVLGRLPREVEFFPGTFFFVGDLRFEPFSVPHDAVDPVGFAIYSDSKKLGVVTDMGYATHLAREKLKGSDAVVIESNHDKKLLMEGPYPWELKQRIASKMGHMANEKASELLESIADDRLRCAVLAHLSEVNNRPELAYEAHRTIAERDGFKLHIARQDRPGEVISF